MIEKVQFRNFKAYRSLDLELEPFTVLVGPNASGKTTLLEGLQLVSRAAEDMGAPHGRQGLDGPIQSHGSNSLARIEVSGTWSGIQGTAAVQEVSYSIGTSKGSVEGRGITITGTWSGRTFPVASEERSERDMRGDLLFNPPLSVFRKAMGSTSVLRFEPRRLAEPSYSDEETPSLESDGNGLASVLAHFKLSRDEIFREIEDALKLVVPAVRRIRIERARVENRSDRLAEYKEPFLWGNQLVFDMQGARGVSARFAGEGTLMALGLLAEVLGPAKPQLVLLDDIELSLHPAAQGRLIEALRKIRKHNPDLQIIATSHSPFILNYLKPEEVRMTFLAENGFARCEKLTAHPEFEKWKDLMAPGEFWSSVGEEWIGKLGGAAANE